MVRQRKRLPDDPNLPLIPLGWTLARRVDGVGYNVAVYVQPGDVGLRQAVKAVDWGREAQ